MADFLIGDELMTFGYGRGILTKSIQYYQRDALRHPDPAWRSTHGEKVVLTGDMLALAYDDPFYDKIIETLLPQINLDKVRTDTVVTFSQTFPFAKYEYRNKAWLQNQLIGDKPRYALLRYENYEEIVTPEFVFGMLEWIDNKMGEGKSWLKALWGRFYDVGGLPMYPINFIRHEIFGFSGTVAWLEKSHANVCTDATASADRAGHVRAGRGEDFIFPGVPSKMVAPSHKFTPESRMIRILP